MNNKTLAVGVLWWFECIVAVRVLLFTFPVLLNKTMNNSMSPTDISDWFMLVMTLSALLYLIAGIASIAGNKKWLLFHYVVTVVVLLLSASFYIRAMKLVGSIQCVFFVPAVFACLVIFGLLIAHKKTKSV